jgi:hypothetical protein
MNKKLIDLTGERFGRLKVLKRDTIEVGARNGKRGQYRWHCRCDCGNTCSIKSGELRYGHTRSCGCLRREMNFKHGHTTHSGKTKTYAVWNAMIQRCTNPTSQSYSKYGARGIAVCTRWLKFENFLADMGGKPDGLTLERRENDGIYTKNNCYWATWKDQNNNKRRHPIKIRNSGLPQGVNKHGKKFTAAVAIKGQRHYLGIFNTPEKALRALNVCLHAHGLRQREVK